MSAGSVAYYPGPPSQSATVFENRTTTVYVDYGASAALTVEVTGLPQGVQGDVKVYGPNSATRLYRALGSTQTFSVPSGTYAVWADPVTSGGDTYVATVTGSPVTLQGGGSATVRVAYRKREKKEVYLLYNWDDGTIDPGSILPLLIRYSDWYYSRRTNCS